MSVFITTHTVTEFLITGLDEVQHPKVVGLAILFVLFLILIGSITNICVIAFNKPLHTPMYFFICSLAVVDIVFSSGTSVTMLNVLLGEERRVPYAPCMIQCFLFHFGSSMEPFAIALMAYDRLIAISYPLRYQTILTNTNVCLLILANWAVGCMLASLLTGLVNNLPFCGSNKLPYSFCEYAALVRAACVNPSRYFNAISALCDLILTIDYIIVAVLKIASTKGRLKTLSICSGQLIIIALYILPRICIYLSSNTGIRFSTDLHIVIIMLYSLLPPMINLLIYCFKTKDMKQSLMKRFKR
uniref:G-protein coupled receptors family 1 profile domain-containing protein n=1 Tax=Oncorhynchus mykiss TaxID=8022 RepID=A0A8C7WE99_ONCMY